MSSDDAKVYQSAYEEYKDTYERQLETQAQLKQRAIEIIKINLLVGGVAASIVTFSPENADILYFVMGSSTLLASSWYCARVYSQTTYDIGLSKSAYEQMVSKDSFEKHAKSLGAEYSSMVEDFNQPYQIESDDFERGLWLSIATLFLYIAGAGMTLLTFVAERQLPVSLDIVILIFICILLMYGKEKDDILNEEP